LILGKAGNVTGNSVTAIQINIIVASNNDLAYGGLPTYSCYLPVSNSFLQMHSLGGSTVAICNPIQNGNGNWRVVPATVTEPGREKV